MAGQSWDLITGGILTGYQLDRVFARRLGLDRSNGCAHADSPSHVPIQRMANVSLQPDPEGGSTAELIAGIEDGIYVVGDKSWSIDMQRYNFQFTGQRFYRIKGGELAGQVRDVAYQATTTDFWGAMDAVGGPQTYLLGGAFNCGKGQPGQVAAVSHGCPAARFRGISILNTVQEVRVTERAITQAAATGILTPQQIIDAALAASTADGCVVVVQSGTEANVRWANNTVTTNGVVPVAVLVRRRVRRRRGRHRRGVSGRGGFGRVGGRGGAPRHTGRRRLPPQSGRARTRNP